MFGGARQELVTGRGLQHAAGPPQECPAREAQGARLVAIERKAAQVSVLLAEQFAARQLRAQMTWRCELHDQQPLGRQQTIAGADHRRDAAHALARTQRIGAEQQRLRAHQAALTGATTRWEAQAHGPDSRANVSKVRLLAGSTKVHWRSVRNASTPL